MIYFIQEAGNGEAPIKIGFTSGSAESRLASLQTGYPAKLAVLATLDGDAAKESALHTRWADLRLHGEWFKADEALLVYISEIEEMEPPEVLSEPTKPALRAVQPVKSMPPPAPWRGAFYDLKEGDRFGLLTFIGAAPLGELYGESRASIVLICDCGKETIVSDRVPPPIMDPQYGYGRIGELLRGHLRECDHSCPIRISEREKATEEARLRRAQEQAKYDEQIQKLTERARAFAGAKK